jgi:hypothetical protein
VRGSSRRFCRRRGQRVPASRRRFLQRHLLDEGWGGVWCALGVATLRRSGAGKICGERARSRVKPNLTAALLARAHAMDGWALTDVRLFVAAVAGSAIFSCHSACCHLASASVTARLDCEHLATAERPTERRRRWRLLRPPFGCTDPPPPLFDDCHEPTTPFPAHGTASSERTILAPSSPTLTCCSPTIPILLLSSPSASLFFTHSTYIRPRDINVPAHHELLYVLIYLSISVHLAVHLLSLPASTAVRFRARKTG